MKGLRLMTIFLAGAMVFSCATTNSQKGIRYSPSMYDAIDRNHDGVIDRDEFLAAAVDSNQANRIFNQVDTNKDNVISREEAEQNRMLMEQVNMRRAALRLVGPQ
jgi:Ca2+-binding EF-hand superfamily protein